MESKQLEEGVFVARTLLSDESKFPAIRVINVGCRPYKVKDGLCIGNAEMIDKTNVVELAELGRITGSTEPVACARQADNLAETRNANSEFETEFEHVQPMIESLPDSLTDQQRQMAIDLIKRNADVFFEIKI